MREKKHADMPEGDFMIPPELMAPAPRRVRLRAVARKYVIQTRSVFAVMAGISLFLVTITCLSLAVRLWAPSGGGTITGYTHSRHGFHAQYVYSIGGITAEGSDQVDQDVRYALPIGANVKVRALQLGPWRLGILIVPWLDYLQIQGIAWIVAIAWNGFIWRVFVAPAINAMRQWRLIRTGLPARGRVLKYTRIPSKNFPRWIVTYEFHLPDGTLRSGEMRLTAAHRNRPYPNTPCTVLYDPKKPDASGRTIAYEYCQYEAV